MKYKPSRDLPRFARENHTLSPTKLQAIILRERNKNVTPESISMWFIRNPEVYEKLKAEILEEQLPDIEISESIFENNNFKKLPSVKNWLLQMNGRELEDSTIEGKLNCLRRLCLGKAYNRNWVKEGKLALKHPDRLTFKDVLEFITLIKELKKDPYEVKTHMKDFLESKGITVGKRFAVGKPKGYGKFKELFKEKDVLKQILDWIKERNFEAYAVNHFMYVNGTRITATLNSLLENLHIVDDVAMIKVFDKGRKSKYPHGHPWNKQVTTELLHDIQAITQTRSYGKLFSITAAEMGKLNREALNIFCSDLMKQFPTLMPNHFWRHMFFQHILRQCNWNYAIAAALGGSTPQSVEESYGKPPEEEIKSWRGKYKIAI